MNLGIILEKSFKYSITLLDLEEPHFLSYQIQNYFLVPHILILYPFSILASTLWAWYRYKIRICFEFKAANMTPEKYC